MNTNVKTINLASRKNLSLSQSILDILIWKPSKNLRQYIKF